MRRNRAENDASHIKLTRRAALMGGAQVLFMGGLAARMRYLQVDQADQFRLLAEENRINIRLIPPARGEIFDRNGTRLAENVPSYRIVMVRVTTEGRRRGEPVAKQRAKTMGRIIGSFEPNERAQLANLLERLNEAIDHEVEELHADQA